MFNIKNSLRNDREKCIKVVFTYAILYITGYWNTVFKQCILFRLKFRETNDWVQGDEFS